MFKLYLNSDNLIEFNGPTDVANSTALSGATCTASLYDDGADTKVLDEEFFLSSDEAGAETTLSIYAVPKVTVAVGDTVRIELDDGTHQDATIAAGSTTTTLVISGGLTSAASKDNKIVMKTKVAGVSILRLNQKIPYELGEQVSITQDDDTQHITTVTDRDFDTNEITLNAVTTAAVSAGNDVAMKIGADVTMSEYGTPVANDTSWGYRGTIADTHSGLKLGQRVRIEIDFNGGAGLQRTEFAFARVTYGGA